MEVVSDSQQALSSHLAPYTGIHAPARLHTPEAGVLFTRANPLPCEEPGIILQVCASRSLGALGRAWTSLQPPHISPDLKPEKHNLQCSNV